MSFLQKCTQTKCIPHRIDPASVFHFKWNTFLTDGQNEINFRFGGPLGKIGNIEMRNTGQERTNGAFSEVSSKVGQMRRSDQSFRIQRHNFLKPARTKPEVDDA